jgi:hypothetical protein
MLWIEDTEIMRIIEIRSFIVAVKIELKLSEENEKPADFIIRAKVEAVIW